LAEHPQLAQERLAAPGAWLRASGMTSVPSDQSCPLEKTWLAVGLFRVYIGYTYPRGRPMAKANSASSIKETRLSIRVDPRRKAVIARAAKRQGHTISDFVLENAFQMASELLADEGTVVLNKKQMAQIFDVLDHPPAKSVAAIRKLLTERSILDG
jgi:uncharacterized protein (DUF1778 family)